MNSDQALKLTALIAEMVADPNHERFMLEVDPYAPERDGSQKYSVIFHTAIIPESDADYNYPIEEHTI